jgi:hypothetical protein
MMHRPERTIVDLRKLEDYCLDPMHPRGRHKARVFREALGIGRGEAAWLRDVLIAALRDGDAHELAADTFGTRWRMDTAVSRQGKKAVVRSVWMVRTGEDVLRLVTCWVL